MCISDWSSDVCSSDLFFDHLAEHGLDGDDLAPDHQLAAELLLQPRCRRKMIGMGVGFDQPIDRQVLASHVIDDRLRRGIGGAPGRRVEIEHRIDNRRSEEHTSELQSLMRISYAVFCLKKKNK